MRIWLLLAGLSGAMAVIAGALGAHASDPAADETVAIAARYQMWHALALLAVAWATTTGHARLARIAGALFAAGIVLFCGSLYIEAATGWQAVTAVTPVGGMAFILGWLAFAFSGYVAVRSAGGDPPKDAASRPPRRP
jgi:uncharacterized membrane protein YgdD (TMEM256/DUF423 family)